MIGDNIREYRQRASMSQKELAFAMGVAQQTISGWESNYRTPDVRLMARLADVLGVSIDTIADTGKGSPRLSTEEESLLNDFKCLSPDEREAVAAMVATLKEARSRKKTA